MAAGQMEIPEGGAVGPQLVGHNQPGREALLSEQFAHQLQGSPPVSPRLDQDIEDLALVIDGAPQIHSPSSDAHDHLVQMPPVARAGPPLPQPPRDHRAELPHPAPDRLIGDIEPALGKKFLHVAVAQGEAEV